MLKHTRIGYLACVVCLCALFGTCPAQSKLIIARHGTSAYDPANPQLVNGVPDPPLSSQGKEEAQRLAQLAKAEGIELIFHSPLRRARETAEIVARELKLKPVVNVALTEFNLGDLLGKDWSQSPYREQLAEVLRHPENKRPGGESFHELSARVTKTWQELRAQYRDKKILLIAHGYTNRALLGRLRGLSTAEAYALPSLANNEVVIVNQAGDVYVQAVTAAATTEAEKWRADLRFMAEEMPRTHKNLFHTMTREQFDAAVKQLHDRIPQLARHQIIVELMRIVAMVGDGHTNIAPTRDPKIGFRAFPVKLYLFKDGLFVRAAQREYAALVGTRVVTVGNTTVEEAVARAVAITGRDNEMGARYFAPFLLAMPEVLHALGLTANPDEAQFTLEKNGQRQTVTLKPIGTPEMMPADTDATWQAKDGWVDLRDQATATTPLWLKDTPNLFWFEYLPESKTVYAQINQVRNKDKETLAAFAERLFAFIAANPVEKLALDLRLNRGGNGGLLRPLVTGILKSKVDQPGKLFVIMGRSTWSAAQFLLNDLEKWANVIFVGEPSGSKGNHYGDSRKITLPDSGITVRVSIYQWLDWSPWDLRPWTAPHLTAELTAEDYRNNADPALKAIQSYTPQKPLAEVLEEGLAKNDLALTAKLFRQFKAEPRNRYLEIDDQMIEIGYGLLRAKKLDAGLLILQLNAETNPQSANAHGALGDAYFVKGEKKLALKHYEQSFALHPGNFDVRDRVRQLRQQ